MAIEKTIEVGGKEVRMRASALIPRFYRSKFNRDLIQDMQKLQKNYQKVVSSEDEQLSIMDLTIFENIAWCMAWHADSESIPSDPDEWLDSIDGVFSIYEVLPQIMDLWSLNLQTTSTPVKK